MNFKINNMPFCARYIVSGKQNPRETSQAYHNKALNLNSYDEAKNLENRRLTAVLGQEYMESPRIQACIHYLPDDTYVCLHTGVEDYEKDCNPYLSFETNSLNEQINIKRLLGKNGDKLELTLDRTGKVDTEKIDSWFDNLLLFYTSQK